MPLPVRILENMAGSSVSAPHQCKDDNPTGELTVSGECRFVYKIADVFMWAFLPVERPSENAPLSKCRGAGRGTIRCCFHSVRQQYCTLSLLLLFERPRWLCGNQCWCRANSQYRFEAVLGQTLCKSDCRSCTSFESFGRAAWLVWSLGRPLSVLSWGWAG